MTPQTGETGTVVLTGYAYSVYTRSLRIALAEKGVPYAYVEVNPFDPADAVRLMREHPFGRVPVLRHESFRLWETPAMLAYVDAAFDGPALVSADVRKAARMRQVIAVSDNYAYVPLVRQAFSHGVFRALLGEVADKHALRTGLEAAQRVLDALDEIAAEGLALEPGQICLASCHLWPMLDYFAMLPEGQEMLARRDALSAWMYGMGQRVSVCETRPDLSDLQEGGNP